ncbi:Serine/threonine kinase [Basidiobolus ranarum]|uniref:protein kinase C n=1 Tax=Basidiobolus ranarum TaxID=34480 RepID=A0ABR2WLD8_9FUNG
MADIETKIQEIYRKISVEEKLMEGVQNMLRQHTGEDIISQCENQIAESQRRIGFLQNELQRLQLRRTQSEPIPPSNSGSGTGPQVSSPTSAFFNNRPGSDSFNSNSIPNSTSDTRDSLAHSLSALDLRRADSEITPQKVAMKLHEIGFKLDVELKVREGSSRLNVLYSDPTQGDRKKRAEAATQLAESNEKVGLLKRALQKYQGLYIDEAGEANDVNAFSPAIRRPQTGRLTIHISATRNLAHPSARLFRTNETLGILSIDGTARARTRPSRNGKWNEEFEFQVDKASEVEIIFYDKSGDMLVPIGMVWSKIADISEEIRKNQLNQKLAGNTDPSLLSTVVDCNLDVEPVGQVGLRLGFVKEAGKKRQVSKLGRQGALRKRKEVVEQNGHRFVAQQFYQIMKCALCDEFLLNASGYQCEDCKYTCHKKCYPKVVLKCITKASGDMNPEEERLNHRIPHRFEKSTTFSPNWCCHCGYMLPLGKRGAMRCTECDITCHESCHHLVPDFCGMTMARANEIIYEIKQAKKKSQEHRQQRPIPPKIVVPPTTTAEQHVVQPPSTPQRYYDPSAQELPVAVNEKVPTQSPQPVGRPVSQPKKKKTGLEDFNLLAVLGKGNFGKVMLAEEKTTRNLYAIKVLKKEFIIQNEEVESTKSEKRVFQAANRERHPFLVGLHSCFQTDTRIYFVMEYVRGGDLMLHIQREQFSEARAKFYACEVLLGLEYFHKNNIVYRDLKLDNILITLEGHIKIADYGLCKENMFHGATTNTFCGTPEFMAPEILLEQRYGRAVDWWAFGVLIYEMLLGQSPFHGEDEDEIFDAILEDEVLYPTNMSRDSVSLIQKLLTRDPEKRLGSGRSDAEEIKRHPFFRGVNWDDIMNKRIDPPFRPKITSRTDISNFDSEFTREKPVLTPVQNALDSVDQEEFYGFSYMADWAGETW